MYGCLYKCIETKTKIVLGQKTVFQSAQSINCEGVMLLVVIDMGNLKNLTTLKESVRKGMQYRLLSANTETVTDFAGRQLCTQGFLATAHKKAFCLKISVLGLIESLLSQILKRLKSHFCLFINKRGFPYKAQTLHVPDVTSRFDVQ